MPQVLALLPCKACRSPLRAGGCIWGRSCHKALALWPHKACRSPLRAASGFLGATFPHPLLAGGAGALGHSCHIPCPHGPARLATALSVQAGAFCHAPWPARLVTALSVQAGALGILVTGLCPLAPQGLLRPSMASQGLLQTSSCGQGLSEAFLPQGLALWPRKACYSPLRAGWGFWGILAKRLSPLAPQGLLQPSARRRAYGHIPATSLGPLALQGLLQSSSCRQGL